MRAAVAGIPGAWSSERMAEALRECGFDAFVFDPAATMHDLASGAVTCDREDLRQLSAIVVKKLPQSSAWSRLHLHALRALEDAGVRVFSAADVIDVAMDRYRMTMGLARAGLPIPATLACHSIEGMREAVSTLGDCVIKPVYTSKGRGMVRATSDTFDAVSAALDCAQPYLVQQFVASPGRDIGATVVGGKFVGAFFRVAQEGEWMTTTAQGGRYEACDLPPAGIALAEGAARAFSLDYTVVDLVEAGGGFLIYEVSAFGGFRGLIEATGVDPSTAYAHRIASEVQR